MSKDQKESVPLVSGARKGSKSQRMAREALARNLLVLTSETWETEALKEAVPEAWHTLEQDLDVAEPKEKVTLYLDRAVVKCFRSMGAGYQARINRILETWMQMKIADVKALEMTLIDALDASQADIDKANEEAEPIDTLTRAARSWAYQQGFRAGLEVARKRKPD